MKLLKLVFLFTVLLSPGIFKGADFDEANKLYEAGKYFEAAAAYNALLSSGNKSAEVYYNLGNAYFKDKKTGLAILNYEKALKLAPRDADIKYNLEFARSFIKEAAVEDTLTKFLNSLYYYLTLNELCILLALAFLSVMGLLTYRLFQKNELSYWLAFSCSVIFGLVFIFSALRIFENETTRAAIVIAPSVEAKAAPLETNPASFTIPEGKKVQILNSRKDWVEIFLKSENMKGWIKQEAIAEI